MVHEQRYSARNVRGVRAHDVELLSECSRHSPLRQHDGELASLHRCLRSEIGNQRYPESFKCRVSERLAIIV
jgi:hypothetical protein